MHGMTKLSSIVVLLFTGFIAQPLAAQSAGNEGRALSLGPGDTIQVLKRRVIDRAPGSRGIRLDVQYSTRIPPNDLDARVAQADRIAYLLGADAKAVGARIVSISICDTRACAEAREPPRQWYVYERGADGIWVRQR